MPNSTTFDRAEIKALMKRAGVRQADIAKACGVSTPAVNGWLKGDNFSAALDKAIPAYIAGLQRGSASSKAAA
jgi:transcriptional regulator with XRE-family HTH domain